MITSLLPAVTTDSESGLSMLYPEKSMVNMMESSLAESMVNNTNNIYDPMVSI